MKKRLHLLLVLVFCSSALFAQSSKSKTTNKTSSKDKYANQEVSYKTKPTKPINKTKLDDLKNPFDTGKVKTVFKQK
jgi:uncharacterized GH25 family protein